MCEKFRDVYERLYNSADTSQEVQEIKERIEAQIGQNSVEEVQKVTGAAVKIAAGMMKKGKADVSGSYTTDAIRNAPDLFYEHLATVYRSWLVLSPAHCWPVLSCPC